MKSFFEEYGFVILAAIVVILLIAMASPIGDLVKAQITGIVDSFANKTESKLNAVDAGAITVRATTSKGKVILTWDAEKAEDTFTVQYRASNDSKETAWSKGEATFGKIAGKSDYLREVQITEASSATKEAGAVTEGVGSLNNGTKVEYKIYDSNKSVVASGTVVARN